MSTQPLFDMSKAQPIQASGAPLFDMSKAQPIGAAKASFWDRFKDQPGEAAYNDALGREVKAAGGAIAGIPSAIYHAFSEPATPEERTEFQGDVDGAKRIGLGIHRLSTAPLEVAAKWYGDVGQGKVPNAYEQALSVAPEAVGSAGGTVLAGKLAESVPAAVSKGAKVVQRLPDAIRPGAAAAGRGMTAVGEMIDPDVAGLISPRLAHFLRTMQKGGKVLNKVGETPAADALDATAENKPYAGEKTPPPTEAAPKPPVLPDELSAARRAAAPTPPRVSNQLQKAISFRPSIERIIDDAVPPKGETYRDNLIAKAAVDQHLEQGNVGAAQQVLDHLKETPASEAAAPAKTALEGHTPEQWQKFDDQLGKIFEEKAPARPKATPEQVQELNDRFRPFLDQAIKEHEAERNIGVKAAPSVPTEEDLTPQLLDSLRAIQARKAFLESNTTHP